MHAPLHLQQAGLFRLHNHFRNQIGNRFITHTIRAAASVRAIPFLKRAFIASNFIAQIVPNPNQVVVQFRIHFQLPFHDTSIAHLVPLVKLRVC